MIGLIARVRNGFEMFQGQASTLPIAEKKVERRRRGYRMGHSRQGPSVHLFSGYLLVFSLFR